MVADAVPSSEEKLPLSVKKRAQKRYLWFTRVNAVSFAILGEGVLILYSVKVGAPDWLISVITSMFYWTMPLMLLGKRLIARMGAARAYSLSWFLRNISASFLILVPFVQQRFYPNLGLFLLTLAGTGFYAFRSMGITAMTPLIGDITSKHDRGQFISTAWLNFNLFYLLVIGVLALVFSRDSSVQSFQFVIGVGVFFGLVASWIVASVPESPRLKRSGQEKLRETLRFFRENLTARRLFWSWIFATMGIMLVMPFSMLSLKKGYLVPDQIAIVFVMIQVSGGILGSFLNTHLLDRVGSKPMLVLYTAGFMLIAFLWLIGPAQLFWPHVVLIFLLAGMSNSGIQSALSHYFLNSTPALNRVSASMVLNIFSGIAAGFAGSVIGGGLLKLLHHFGVEGILIYRTYFGAVLLIQMAILAVVLRLPALVPKGVRDVLGILFSFRDWRALYVLQKLARAEAEEEEQQLVEQLREIGSELTEEALLGYLESPKFYIRSKAIRALGQIDFSPQTARRLIQEVEQGEYTTAYLAAEVLGEHGVREAIPVLRRALRSKDVFLQGKAMLALARLGDRESFPEILQLFRASENPRILIHGAMAFVEMKDPLLIGELIRKAANPELPRKVRDELLYAMSELAGCGNTFYRLYKIFLFNRDEGVRALEETIDRLEGLPDEIRQRLRELVRQGKKSGSHDISPLLQLLSDYLVRETPVLRAIREYFEKEGIKQVGDNLYFTLLLIIAREIQKAV